MHMVAPFPSDEARRLARLQALQVLDSEAEPLFDALTRAVSLVLGTPIALVSLIDRDRQWFKSSVGLEAGTQTPRDVSFCAHAILGDDVFEVADARADPRFAGNPLVTGQPDIRFYAGAPITLHDGLRMGTLCVIDRQPRQLDDAQRALLKQLARVAAEALDQRVLALQRDAALRREGEALRLRAEDHDRLASVIEATGAGIWEWNVQTGEMRASPHCADLLGYPAERFASMSSDDWRRMVHPDDVAANEAALQSHLAGDRDHYDSESRLRHRDGHWVWFHSRGRIAVRDDAGRPLWLHGTHVDNSARKAAERRLRDSEALLDRTGQVAGVGGWQVDLHSGEIHWTAQTCRLHQVPVGYRPDMEEALRYFPAEAGAQIAAAIKVAVEQGSGWDLETPFVDRLGNAMWVRTVGEVEFDGSTPRRLVGAFQDITARHRAQRAMEASERRFRRLFEHSTGMICTHDLDGIILSVNPAAARHLGYPIEQMLGRPFTDFIAPERHARFAGYLQQMGRHETLSGLLYLIAADGSERVWQFENVRGDEDGTPYVLGHAQDVTERTRQQRQLRDWSIRDPLTGCHNRRFLAETAEAMGDESWGCIAIDLDRFKLVNDTHGHERGDQVLVAMGEFLRQHVRPDDIVVRAGGDEFLLLIRDADEAATHARCQQLRAAAASAPIGFTLGHAVRSAGESLDLALKRADDALYAVRALRRDATSR